MADPARQALEANGLGDRAEAIGGDFFVDVPEGDVYLLKQILHDWNDESAGPFSPTARAGSRATG